MTMEAYAAYTIDGGSRGELWNAARLKAYVDAGYKPRRATIRVPGYCSGMVEALDDVPYTYPSDPLNPAPWYDSADPASADFAGLLILKIDGWDTAPYTKSTFNRISAGAVLGRGRYGPRTMVVDALLIGRTCCSLQSGLKWLTSTLADCNPCGGQELSYFECCPGDTCSVPVGGHDESDITDELLNHARSLRQAGLTVGVTVTEKAGMGSCPNCRGGCTYMRVSFTLTAGDPFSYGAPVCYATDHFRDPTADGALKFAQGEDCADPCQLHYCPTPDPGCTTYSLPPELPPSLRCQCEPLTFAGSYSQFNVGAVPRWQQSVPLLSITAGSSPLRHVKVRIYNNPEGYPPNLLTDCDIVSQFIVSFIDSGSTFTFDGRDRRFYMSCFGTTKSNASRLVDGVGGPFKWPVLGCGTNYTIFVTADGSTFPEAAGHESSYELCLVPRSAA